MTTLSLSADPVDLVICGRYDETDSGDFVPDDETEQIIQTLSDRLEKRELYPYARLNFCNCGSAYDYGPSITVLPEKVRYLDVDESTIDAMIDRHVLESDGRESED
jgi:(2Fe-2S) ferredoxin